MNVLFECSSHLRSFINIMITIITLLLWLLYTGSLVLSLHFAPHFFTPEGGCESSACFDECVERGFPMVEIGQPTPMMMHLCDGDDCYCSTQEDNDEYAWTKGRVIEGYECVMEPVPDEGEDTYTIETCVKECIDQGFELKEVDQHDENISDDAPLIFNLLVNDDCCCGARPRFSEEMYYLPVDDNEGELDESQEFNTAGEPQGFDKSQSFGISGEFQDFMSGIRLEDYGSRVGIQDYGWDIGLQDYGSAIGLDGSGVSGEIMNFGENLRKRKKFFPSAYPGYEMYKDDLEGYGPLRESSKSKPPLKKPKNGDDQQEGGEINSQLQTPDPDN